MVCLLLVLSGPAVASPWRTSNRAKLELSKVGDGFRLTLTNTQKRPLAVVPPASHWRHGWDVKVTDRQGEVYGLMVPPGPAFMAEPGCFQVLQSQQKITVNYRFADFLRVDRKTDSHVMLKEQDMVEVAYVIVPDQELTRATQRSFVNADPLKSVPSPWAKLFSQADFLVPVQARLKL